MSTKSKRHPHKYYRVQVAGADVWACALPDCLHYMPKHMEKMVNNKATICWQCGEITAMTPASMAERQPRCDDCRFGMPQIPISPTLLRKMVDEPEIVEEVKVADSLELVGSDAAKKLAEFLRRK